MPLECDPEPEGRAWWTFVGSMYLEYLGVFPVDLALKHCVLRVGACRLELSVINHVSVLVPHGVAFTKWMNTIVCT